MAKTKSWAQRGGTKGPRSPPPSDPPQIDQRVPSPPPQGVHLSQVESTHPVSQPDSVEELQALSNTVRLLKSATLPRPQDNTQPIPLATTWTPRWALIVGLQALSIQRSEIRRLRESLRHERLEKSLLQDALDEAEARRAEPSSATAVASTHEVPSWQRAEVCEPRTCRTQHLAIAAAANWTSSTPSLIMHHRRLWRSNLTCSIGRSEMGRPFLGGPSGARRCRAQRPCWLCAVCHAGSNPRRADRVPGGSWSATHAPEPRLGQARMWSSRASAARCGFISSVALLAQRLY